MPRHKCGLDHAADTSVRFRKGKLPESVAVDQEIRRRHQVFRIRMFHAKALQRAQVIPVSQLLEQLLLYYPKAISGLRPKLSPDVMPEIILNPIVVQKRVVYVYEKSDVRTSHGVPRFVEHSLQKMSPIPIAICRGNSSGSIMPSTKKW